MLPLPVMVPTWHCIGAPGFCAVFPSNTVLSMTRSGEPKIAAANMLGASHTLFANVQFSNFPPPPNSASVAPTLPLEWLP